MLSYISVKNFAIIENIEVNFKSGMTALTGETGAGKSLLIDAIGLLLGGRASSNVVRTGENKAIVTGVFEIKNKKIDQILENLGISNDSHELIIKREISSSNNNLIRVNNNLITLAQLNTITLFLADIHTQHDTHKLINVQTYLDIIDGFKEEETKVLLEEYNVKLHEYKKHLKEFSRLKNSNNSLIERLDLMRFQVQEITDYNLDHDEKDDLINSLEKLRNYDKIYQSLNEAYILLESTSVLDNIYDSTKRLQGVTDFSEEYETIKKSMDDSFYTLDDAIVSLKKEIDSLDFDPNLLQEYEDRLNSLESLENKYRKSIPEIIEYLEKIKTDINNIDNYDQLLLDQENVVKTSFNDLLKSASDITNLRKETSRHIETDLLDILSDLELKKASFSVAFLNCLPINHLDQSKFFDNGVDEIDFLLTTNIGEPLKALSKSASGGEMSRIMLGLKTLLARSQNLSLIIFDEIDSGVSGYVARQVAKKMLEISKSSQVICITHIPQVAAISDNHLFISKSVEDNRTKAHIKTLDYDGKIQEIASMISGDLVTEASLLSAKQLIEN